MNNILTGVLPADLELPKKFETFRPIQGDMADFAVYGPNGQPPRLVHAMGAPTGSGKV